MFMPKVLWAENTCSVKIILMVRVSLSGLYGEVDEKFAG